jgi:hypothetical protein
MYIWKIGEFQQSHSFQCYEIFEAKRSITNWWKEVKERWGRLFYRDSQLDKIKNIETHIANENIITCVEKQKVLVSTTKTTHMKLFTYVRRLFQRLQKLYNLKLLKLLLCEQTWFAQFMVKMFFMSFSKEKKC